MLVRPNRKANDNRIEEWRIAAHVTLCRKIRPNVEFEFITTRLHRIACKQRCIAAPVAIGHRGREQLSLLAWRIKPNGNIACWLAVRGVENVRGQLSHYSPRLVPTHYTWTLRKFPPRMLALRPQEK